MCLIIMHVSLFNAVTFTPMYIPTKDTAAVYKNEKLIGEALKDLCPKLGIPEREILLTSKLGMSQPFTANMSGEWAISSLWGYGYVRLNICYSYQNFFYEYISLVILCLHVITG